MKDDLGQNVRRALAGQLRITVLALLHGLPRFTAAFDTLHVAVRSMSHGIDRAGMRAELDWLAERGLVRIEDGDTVTVALTDRGAEVASGDATVDGVERLRPNLVI